MNRVDDSALALFDCDQFGKSFVGNTLCDALWCRNCRVEMSLSNVEEGRIGH